MPEIYPNWHPAFVHFPIALAITATLLLLLGRLRQRHQLLASGRLLVALAALGAVIAVALGWQAFQTVDHDAAGHLVMLRHRNWAVAVTLGLIVMALWDAWRQRAGQAPHPLLILAMLLLSGSLCFIGWLGGEMVYRHGIGVSPSAFAPPEMQPPSLPGAAEAALPPTADEPPLAPGEHIHKDGKRHHH